MKSQIISELKSIIATCGRFEVNNLVVSDNEEMVEMIVFLNLDNFDTDIARKTTEIVEAISYGEYEELELSTLNSLLDLAKVYKITKK